MEAPPALDIPVPVSEIGMVIVNEFVATVKISKVFSVKSVVLYLVTVDCLTAVVSA